MANNYLQFSLAFKVNNKHELEWLERQLDQYVIFPVDGPPDSYKIFDAEMVPPEYLPQYNAAEYHGDVVRGPKFLLPRVIEHAKEHGIRLHEAAEYLNCHDYGPEFELETSPERNLAYIFAEEYGDPNHVVEFVQQYLKKYKPNGIVRFCTAYTCSKPRTDEFGGEGIVITATTHYSMDTYEFAARKIQDLISESNGDLEVIQ